MRIDLGITQAEICSQSWQTPRCYLFSLNRDEEIVRRLFLSTRWLSLLRGRAELRSARPIPTLVAVLVR